MSNHREKLISGPPPERPPEGQVGSEFLESTEIETKVFVEKREREVKERYVFNLREFPASDNIRMFELRKQLISNPVTEQYKWLSQTIEAYFREFNDKHERSDYGCIAGIILYPSKESVHLLVEHPSGDDLGSEASKYNFELSLHELQKRSLELVLDELDKTSPLETMRYSPEMSVAITEQPEHVQYRWDLITRAARHITQGHSECLGKEMKVSLTKEEVGTLNGLGVFLTEVGAQQERRQWAAVKVIDNEVPLTSKEHNWIKSADATKELYRSEDRNLKQFSECLYWIYRHIRDDRGYKDGFAGSLKRPTATRIKVFFQQFASELGKKNSADEFIKALNTLYHQDLELDMEIAELPDQVREQIFTKKSAYSPEQPFECLTIPEELASSLDKGVKRRVQNLKRRIQLVQQHMALILSTIPNSTTDRNYHDFQEHVTLSPKEVKLFLSKLIQDVE